MNQSANRHDTHVDISAEQLARAIERDEFVFHYQPQISMLSGKVCGAEALIRWTPPSGDVILPSRFIPLAEANAQIRALSVAMFPKLVSDLVIIHDVLPELVMSFNLTAQDFESDEMLSCVSNTLERFQVSPHLLKVELTETSLINSSEHVRHNIKSLLQQGVSLAMDDFGTGYSSIDVLSQWDFSTVKIDQGLIKRMLTSERSTTIVESSINMAHQLGLEIVAEGIESEAVYEYLLNAGCTEAQGFWLARPMPLAELLSFLRKDRRWPGMPIGLIHMAQLDHIQWRRSLIEHVMTKAFNGGAETGVRSVLAEMDHTRCKLGQWYHGIGQEYKGIPCFDALDTPHQQLHAIGQQLLDAVNQADPLSEVTQQLQALSQKSGELLSLLHELEYYARLRQTGHSH